MTTITTAWMLGFACGFLPFLAVVAGRRNGRRRGSNPPPYSSAAIAWQAEIEASRAKFIDPSMGKPWDELWDEGHTQRGNGSGGPTTPKTPIKPQPSGGRQVGDLLKPEFPPPRTIRGGLL